jgi:hypothetical protein
MFQQARSLREAEGSTQAFAATWLRTFAGGRSHSVWVNRANDLQAAIPRHREISDYTARGICRQLGVAEP